MKKIVKNIRKNIRKTVALAIVGTLMALMITGCHSDKDESAPVVAVESVEDTNPGSADTAQNDTADTTNVPDATDAADNTTDAVNSTESTDGNMSEASDDTADSETLVEATPAVYDSFDDVIAAYKEAYSEDFDSDTIFDKNMSSLLIFMDKTPGTIGYLMYDLNFDGEDELLIGTNTGDEYQDQIILDAYMMKDGKAVQLFVSSERDRYYIMEDEAGPRIICNEWSASAFVSGYTYYTMIENDLSDIQAIVFDSELYPENPWFTIYTDDNKVTPDEVISEEEAFAIIDSYADNYKTFTYTPIQ